MESASIKAALETKQEMMRRIEEQLAHPSTGPPPLVPPRSELRRSAKASRSETVGVPDGAAAPDKQEPGWVDRIVTSLLASVVENLHVTVENLNFVVVCPLSFRRQHFGTYLYLGIQNESKRTFKLDHVERRH